MDGDVPFYGKSRRRRHDNVDYRRSLLNGVLTPLQLCGSVMCLSLAGHTHTVPRALFPLRAKRFEPSFLEVIRPHHHAKLTVGIERKKPWLHEFWNL